MNVRSDRSSYRSGWGGGVRAGRGFAAVGVVAVGVLLASGCGADAKDDKSPEHRSFALSGRTLTVDSDDSALEIVPGDGRSVEVTRWFQGSAVAGKEPRVTWRMRDDRLTLRMKCAGVVVSCEAKHRIEVPRGVSLVVRDQDGSVRASGFREAVSVRSADGRVTVRDVTGPLDLHSQDGSLTALDVDSRRVSAGSGDGAVRLDLNRVPDRVEARAGDGSVTITLPGGADGVAYKVDTRSQDGGVDVSVPRDRNSDHVVSARTGDGKVTVRSAG